MNVSVIFIFVILIKLYRDICFDLYFVFLDVKLVCENLIFLLDCNILLIINCRKNLFICKGLIFFLNYIIIFGLKWLFYLDIYIFVFLVGKCVDVLFGGVYNKCISIGFSYLVFLNYNFEVKFLKFNLYLDLIFNF